MTYTYKGTEYPKVVKLNHPEILSILGNIQPELKDFNYVLSLPADTLRKDLENLLLREIGRMRDMSEEEVKDYTSKSEVAIQCLLIYIVVP